jgi:hypothetical protein
MIVVSGYVTVVVMLLTVTMVTTSSLMGVTVPDVSTATNLSALMPPKMSALRGSSSGIHPKEVTVTIGVILPHTNFGVREYIRAIKVAVEKLTKSRGPKLNFLKKFNFSQHQVHSVMMTLTPSPTGEYTIVFR